MGIQGDLPARAMPASSCHGHKTGEANGISCQVLATTPPALKSLCALSTPPPVHTGSEALSRRGRDCSSPRQPPLTARCPHSPSFSTWSSSFCPLKLRAMSTENTERVTAPAAQLPASVAASPVATRPPGPAGLSPGPCRTLRPKGTAARGRQQPLRAAGAPRRRARMALPGQQAGLGPSCGGAGREPGAHR